MDSNIDWRFSARLWAIYPIFTLPSSQHLALSAFRFFLCGLRTFTSEPFCAPSSIPTFVFLPYREVGLHCFEPEGRIKLVALLTIPILEFKGVILEQRKVRRTGRLARVGGQYRPGLRKGRQASQAAWRIHMGGDPVTSVGFARTLDGEMSGPAIESPSAILYCRSIDAGNLTVGAAPLLIACALEIFDTARYRRS